MHRYLPYFILLSFFPVFSSAQFITGTTAALPGVNVGKAMDLEFDNFGNVFVTGGTSAQGAVAKYDKNGVHQWTFNGSIPSESWTYGNHWGGWSVERSTGNVYLGQGSNAGGSRIVRLDGVTGTFDGYITDVLDHIGAKAEIWKLRWYCIKNVQQILVAGGSGTDDYPGSLALLSPRIPNFSFRCVNMTAAGTWHLDIADVAVDPDNSDIYAIFASDVTGFVHNRIYKNAYQYDYSYNRWNMPSGYTVLKEGDNVPFMTSTGGGTNACNILAVNRSYLFYYDGEHLKAFNKLTGTQAGTPITLTGQPALMQQGIYADECNNVFIGMPNGTIKVYRFTGTMFDDSPADITIPGHAGKHVYAMKADKVKKLLYASGEGFVGAFDISSYCAIPLSPYTLSATVNCGNLTATLSPVPPTATAVRYTVLRNGLPVISNTTGEFSGLDVGSYVVQADLTENCERNAVLQSPVVVINTVQADIVTKDMCGTTTSNGSITITPRVGRAPFTYSIDDGVSFQTSNVFNNLPGNTYFVVVKDALNCTYNKVVFVLQNPLELSSTIVNVCGTGTGSITLATIRGKPPLTFSIDGTNYQSSNVFSGLAPNNYTSYVKDNTGCIVTRSTPVVANNLSATLSIRNGCGAVRGGITITAANGVAPYTYSIDGLNFQTARAFINLAAGNYTIYLKDATGCVINMPAVVTENLLSITPVVQNACGGNNGVININAVNGVAPYTYSLDGSAFQSSNVFTGLAARAYTIVVRDASVCQISGTATVGAGSLSVTTTVQSACGTTATGSITVQASSGTAPYTYSIDNITFQSGNVFSALAARTYTVYVKDATGCTANATATVQMNGLTVTTTIQDVCGATNGSIIVQASNGTVPYSYSLDGTTFQSGNVFAGLIANTYTIYVKDALGCEAVQTATVLLNNLFVTLQDDTSVCAGKLIKLPASSNGTTFNWTPVTNLSNPSVLQPDANPTTTTKYYISATKGSCTLTDSMVVNISGALSALTTALGSCNNKDGAITVTPLSGTAPFTFSLDGATFQSSNIFSNVSGGTYTVTVRDAAGCQGTQGTIVPLNNLFVTLQDDTTICTGRTVTLPAASNGLIVSWTPITDLNDPTILQPQANPATSTKYYISATKGSCTITDSIVVTIAGALQANTTIQDICGTLNGSIALQPLFGTPPFSYSIDGTTFQSNNTFAGLTAATYTLTLQDALGCRGTQNATVQLSDLFVQVQDDSTICTGSTIELPATSNGTSFNWMPATALNNAAALQPKATPTTATKYYINATKANCTLQDSIVVNLSPAPIANAGTDVTICYGGSTQLQGSGGIGFEWRPSTDLSASSVADPIVADLTSTTEYALFTTDAYGCRSVQADTVKVTVMPMPGLNAGNDTTVTINESLQLNAQDVNNAGFINYTWSPATGLNNSSIANPIATIDHDIVYTVIASTAAGCEAQAFKTIRVMALPTTGLFIPNAFTPNGDHSNDVLKIRVVGMKKFSFTIFNKWGQRVFQTTDASKGWDGNLNGNRLSSDTFVWIAEAIDQSGKTIRKKGTVLLIR